MLTGLALSSTLSRMKQYDFRLSEGGFRDDEIFNSALAVPGRYILEVGRRMLQDFPFADWLVVANPHLPMRGELLQKLVTDCGVKAPGIGTDPAGFPIFYMLPRDLFEDLSRFLLLLSATDGGLDARLLGGVLGDAVTVKPCGLPIIGDLPGFGANQWLNGDRRMLSTELTCGKAISIIESNPDWKRLPFVVHYPMHAGDVLFFAVASKRAEPNFFSKQIVCTSYRDIPEACGSQLETIPLPLPWISRDGSVSELEYFKATFNRLGPEVIDHNFIVFSRLLKPYSRSPFHLVDHAAFALGDPMDDYKRTIYGRPTAPDAVCERPAQPLRVLFHINGGWSLKNLPDPIFRAVTKSLVALGCEVSVVDRPDLEGGGVRSVSAGVTSTLIPAVKDHHIFVGIDSFPHHFVRQCMGWPTVALFSNTKRCNSDAFYGPNYRSSDRYLSCNRCGGYDVCPMFSRDDCVNYATPSQIVEDILDLAQGVYGFQP